MQLSSVIECYVYNSQSLSVSYTVTLIDKPTRRALCLGSAALTVVSVAELARGCKEAGNIIDCICETEEETSLIA